MVQRSGEQQQRPFSERGKQSPVDFSESPHGVGTSRLSEQRRRIAFPLKDLFSVIPGRVVFSLPPPAGLLRKEVLRKRKQTARSVSLWATFPQSPAGYPGAGPQPCHPCPGLAAGSDCRVLAASWRVLRPLNMAPLANRTVPISLLYEV